MGFLNPTAAAAEQTKKKGGKVRPEVEVAKLEKLASLAAVIEALTARYESLDAEVRSDALDYMVAEGVKSGKTPENPVLTNGIGTANFQIKSRSPLSALTDELAAELEEKGIPTEKRVVVPSYLAVHPAYAADEDLLAKADKALSGAKLPADFIVMTAAKETKIVSKGAIDEVFASKDEDLIRELLPHVSSMAIGSIAVSDIARAMEIAQPEVAALYPNMAGAVSTKAPAKARA